MALATGRAVWVEDLAADPDWPRRKQGLAAGLRSAFAVPVVLGCEVVAVLEFFSRTHMEPPGSFLDVLHSAGVQLGRVVERQRTAVALSRADEAVRALGQRLPGAHLPLLPAGVHSVVGGTVDGGRVVGGDVGGVVVGGEITTGSGGTVSGGVVTGGRVTVTGGTVLTSGGLISAPEAPPGTAGSWIATTGGRAPGPGVNAPAGDGLVVEGEPVEPSGN